MGIVESKWVYKNDTYEKVKADNKLMIFINDNRTEVLITDTKGEVIAAITADCGQNSGYLTVE